MDSFCKNNTASLKDYICDRFKISRYDVYVSAFNWDESSIRFNISIKTAGLNVRFNNYLVTSSGYIREINNSEITARTTLLYEINPDKRLSPEVIREWLAYAVMKKAKLFAENFTNKVKEDLIAEVWHPRRVAKWVEAGVALEEL